MRQTLRVGSSSFGCAAVFLRFWSDWRRDGSIGEPPRHGRATQGDRRSGLAPSYCRTLTLSHSEGHEDESTRTSKWNGISSWRASFS